MAIITPFRHIHCMGIGGVGMSACAQMLISHGVHVSGCESNCNQHSVASLKTAGCTVMSGHSAEHCADSSIDLVAFSTMIAEDHPELVAARAQGIPVVHRSEVLAYLMQGREAIAVAGSHGKTTTTSMVGHIFTHAGLDPSILVGGFMTETQSNVRCGSSDYMVVEADESDRSFLRLMPTSTIVTAISFEHVETYVSLDDVVATFQRYIEGIPARGVVVMGVDSGPTAALRKQLRRPCMTYGMSAEADFQLRDCATTATASSCTLWDTSRQCLLGCIDLPMPGYHNLLNAAGAAVMALAYGIPFAVIQEALRTFRGVEQRFTYRGLFRGAEIMDDYGHHPTEIACALSVARARAKGRLIVVFQPHRYSRTGGLWHEFVTMFGAQKPDYLLISDIYAASEQPCAGVTGERLANVLRDVCSYPVEYIPEDASWEVLKQRLNELVLPEDLVLFLGAGRINAVARDLVSADCAMPTEASCEAQSADL